MLEIDSAFQDVFRKLGLSSCGSIIRRFGGDERSGKTTVLVRRESLPLPDGSVLDVFYKQYEYRAASWRFLGRASKARCEFRNYGVLAQLGIAAAQPIAWGEERDALARLCRAFVITRAIPAALTLREFIEQRCPNRHTAEARRIRHGLARQLAEMTRRIHNAGFFHHDLVWRNILATHEPPTEPRLWWIDCPRGRFDHWSPWRRRRRLKDLASLDKLAARLCAAVERVEFAKRYLETPRLDERAKRVIRDVLRYRKTRWPDD